MKSRDALVIVVGRAGSDGGSRYSFSKMTMRASWIDGVTKLCLPLFVSLLFGLKKNSDFGGYTISLEEESNDKSLLVVRAG